MSSKLTSSEEGMNTPVEPTPGDPSPLQPTEGDSDAAPLPALTAETTAATPQPSHSPLPDSEDVPDGRAETIDVSKTTTPADVQPIEVTAVMGLADDKTEPVTPRVTPTGRSGKKAAAPIQKKTPARAKRSAVRQPATVESSESSVLVSSETNTEKRPTHLETADVPVSPSSSPNLEPAGEPVHACVSVAGTKRGRSGQEHTAAKKKAKTAAERETEEEQAANTEKVELPAHRVQASFVELPPTNVAVQQPGRKVMGQNATPAEVPQPVSSCPSLSDMASPRPQLTAAALTVCTEPVPKPDDDTSAAVSPITAVTQIRGNRTATHEASSGLTSSSPAPLPFESLRSMTANAAGVNIAALLADGTNPPPTFSRRMTTRRAKRRPTLFPDHPQFVQHRELRNVVRARRSTHGGSSASSGNTLHGMVVGSHGHLYPPFFASPFATDEDVLHTLNEWTDSIPLVYTALLWKYTPHAFIASAMQHSPRVTKREPEASHTACSHLRGETDDALGGSPVKREKLEDEEE